MMDVKSKLSAFNNQKSVVVSFCVWLEKEMGCSEKWYRVVVKASTLCRGVKENMLVD